LGAVSPDTAVPGVTLVFHRSAAQEAALKELLAAQQNPASPLYHQWLTPEAFAARFGVADEDIATAERWLVSRGFHIDNVTRSRDRVTFSGTAAQVQAAFGAELHHYLAEGELHFAPASDVSLPAELASVTAAVLHISDFRPKANVRALSRIHPEYTSSPAQTHYLGPKDIATMYNLNALHQQQYSGVGQGLAVVGQSFVDLTSGVSYFQGNLAQANNISTVLVPGSGVQAISPGDLGESEIDLEYAAGVAPNASIFLVYVGDNKNYDVFDALAFAITEKVAPVISISYGACEAALSTTELDQYNALFEEAAAQGQTLVAAAGDTGSTACAYYSATGGVTPAQQQALSVDFPASSPYVTAVGGTQMASGTFASGSSLYWAGATNSAVVSSLLSYVPEVAWNENSASNGIAAGGGGTSAYFPRPAWQSAVPGIPTGSYRLVPDVALQSSIASPGFLVCISDASLVYLHGQTNTCANGLLGSNNEYTTAGGTSFAAPIFAGFVAILNGFEHAAGQGNINPQLYKLASDPASYATAFHDITLGTNACSSSVANCPTAGQSNFAATTGYDQATGLGSVDFNALANAWPPSNTAKLQPTVLTLFASPTAAAAGQAVSIQIFVDPLYTQISQSAAISAATGSVSVSVDGVAVGASLPLSSNGSQVRTSATYNFIGTATPGSHLIAVIYPGDATHLPSTATYSLLVGNVRASGGLSLSAGNVTITNGSTGKTQIMVTPNTGYHGRVVWSLAFSAASPTLTACYSIPSLLVNDVSTTQLTIGIGAACNSPQPHERGTYRPFGTLASAKTEAQVHRKSTRPDAVYFCLLVCGLFAGWRRRTHLSLLGAIVSLALVGMAVTGCGGGGSGSNTGTSPTPPSSSTTYSITLTGKDSVNTSITASTTFSLTVN
jgi:subtilase family serine protease